MDRVCIVFLPLDRELSLRGALLRVGENAASGPEDGPPPQNHAARFETTQTATMSFRHFCPLWTFRRCCKSHTTASLRKQPTQPWRILFRNRRKRHRVPKRPMTRKRRLDFLSRPIWPTMGSSSTHDIHCAALQTIRSDRGGLIRCNAPERQGPRDGAD